MKKVNVKTHKRKGKVVRSHSRTAKSEGVKMDYKVCKDKYDKLSKKLGPDHPMVQKLADKLEEMDTVTKHAQTTERFMRKKLKDEDIVKKEAKTKVKKNARTTLNKRTGKYESTGIGSGDTDTANLAYTYADNYKKTTKKKTNKNINAKQKTVGLVGIGDTKGQYGDRKVSVKELRSEKSPGGLSGSYYDTLRSDSVGKKHSATGKGNKALKRTAEAKKQKAMSGKVKNPKTGRMVSKEYLEKNK